MYHPLAVYVYQSPGRVFELLGAISSAMGAVDSRKKPYRLKPIHIPMRLDKLIDVSIGHPFRYHCKVAITHCHSQQWEDIWMVEAFPHYNLLVEHLYNCSRS